MEIEETEELLLREYYKRAVTGGPPFENLDPLFIEMMRSDIGFAAMKAQTAIAEFIQAVDQFRLAMTEDFKAKMEAAGFSMEKLERQMKAQADTDDFFARNFPPVDPEDIN